MYHTATNRSTRRTRREPLQAGALLAVLALACWTPQAAEAPGGRVRLTPVRAHPWRLPESILRETLATIDRAQLHLAHHQQADGFWPGRPDVPTCGPADGWPPEPADPAKEPADSRRRAIAAAEERLERWLGRPLNTSEQLELARDTALVRQSGRRPELVRRAARRLAATAIDGTTPFETALLLEARGLEDPHGIAAHEWSNVIAKAMRSSARDAAVIAISGWARLQRGADPRGQAARAHLRALHAKLTFTAADAGPGPAEEDARVSPEALWWSVRFLDKLPPAVLFEEGFPLDWRVRVADELLRRQLRDPASGSGYWVGADRTCPSAPATLAATTYALQSLLRITEGSLELP